MGAAPERGRGGLCVGYRFAVFMGFGLPAALAVWMGRVRAGILEGARGVSVYRPLILQFSPSPHDPPALPPVVLSPVPWSVL